MNLQITRNRLTEGVGMEENILVLPPEGGGILLPEIARSRERWLNLHMEVLGPWSQAFELRLYATEEEPRVIIRFGLLPRFRTCVALDLNWMDGHILFPGHRPGCQKIVVHGSRICRDEIRKAEMVSMPSEGEIRLFLGQAVLEDAPGAPEMPEAECLIDEMGQWTGKGWDRCKDLQTMTERMRREADREAAYPESTWSPYGGDRRYVLREGTGFFSRERKDGRWHLTDPEGNAFFSMGPDCVVSRCDARIDGMEAWLSPLPEEKEYPELYAGREPFGESGREARLFSYERWNLMRSFGADWEEKWRRMTVGQLKRMGMNSLGNWSDPALFGAMPYVTSLPRFPDTKHRIFRDFPDVLSEEYRRDTQVCARALEARKDDPWMIGYFLRNEPAWAFVDNLILAEEVLRDPEDSACKRELMAFLREKYGTPQALSLAWEHPVHTFEELERGVEHASSFSLQAREDLRTFSARLVRAYMTIPCQACRQVDGNHMILGMRWAWISDPLLVEGWEAFDVFSINCYAVDPTPALERVRELGVDLPVMVGEFHFGARDAGLPATGLEAVRDQADRGRAYRYYLERVAAHPLGAGAHWFQCYDQFALGRFDGENYNIGLFDVTFRPYPALAEASRKTAERVYALRMGTEAPFGEKPDSRPMIAY